MHSSMGVSLYFAIAETGVGGTTGCTSTFTLVLRISFSRNTKQARLTGNLFGTEIHNLEECFCKHVPYLFGYKTGFSPL